MFRVVFFVVSAFAAVCSAATLPAREGRIVGGSDASIYDFPHQVSLKYTLGTFRYGGSIYSRDIIITGGQCVKYISTSEVSVTGGSSFLYEPAFEIAVKNIIVHPKFKTSNPVYDVAILVLSEPLTFGPAVQPIPLAKARPPQGTIGTITGWGQLQYPGEKSNHLQKVDVTNLTNKECLKVYTIFIGKTEICTYDEGKDACYADRGGPMVVNNELMGVVSWGGACAQVEEPRVHASVPDLYDWIVETAKENTAYP